jgi:hypothetical protein
MIEAASLECECVADKLVTTVGGVSDLNHIFEAQRRLQNGMGKSGGMIWGPRPSLKGEHEI